MMMKSVLLLAVLAVAAKMAESSACTEVTEIISGLASVMDPDWKGFLRNVSAEFESDYKVYTSCFQDAYKAGYSAAVMADLATSKDFFCDSTCATSFGNLGDDINATTVQSVCSPTAQSCLGRLTNDFAPMWQQSRLDKITADYYASLIPCAKDLPEAFFQGTDLQTPEQLKQESDKNDDDGFFGEVRDGTFVSLARTVCATPPGKPTTYCGSVLSKSGELEDAADCDALTGEAQKNCFCQKVSKAGCCTRTWYDWAKSNDEVKSAATEIATEVQTYCSINVATSPTCAGSSNSVSSVKYAQAKLALSNVQCGQSTADLSYAVVKIVAAKTGLSVAEVSASVAAGTCACCSDVASAASRRLLTTVSPQFDVTMQASDDAALATASSSLTTAIAGGTLDVASQSGVLGSTAGVDAAKSVAPQTMTASSDLGSSAAAQSVLAVGLLVVAAMLF